MDGECALNICEDPRPEGVSPVAACGGKVETGIKMRIGREQRELTERACIRQNLDFRCWAAERGVVAKADRRASDRVRMSQVACH
jgi:hypothetical protein